MSLYKAYKSLIARYTVYWIDHQNIPSIDLRLYAAHILKGDNKTYIIKAPVDAKLFKKKEFQLFNYLSDYTDIFLKTAAGILPKYAEHNHAIELEPGTTPLYKPIYGLTETEHKVLKNYLNKAQEKS